MFGAGVVAVAVAVGLPAEILLVSRLTAPPCCMAPLLLLLLLPPLLLPPPPPPPPSPPALLGIVVATVVASSEAAAAAAAADSATPSNADDAGPAGAAVSFGSGKGDDAKPSALPPPEAGAPAEAAVAAAAAGAVEAEKSAMLPIMYSDTTRGSTEDAGSRMTASIAECTKALSAELLALGFPVEVAVLPVEEEEAPPMLVWPPEGCRESALAGSGAKKTKQVRSGMVDGRVPTPTREAWGKIKIGVDRMGRQRCTWLRWECFQTEKLVNTKQYIIYYINMTFIPWMLCCLL